jgi:hypothetical protein
VSVSASSIAAAIQSEHTVDADAGATAGAAAQGGQIEPAEQAGREGSAEGTSAVTDLLEAAVPEGAEHAKTATQLGGGGTRGDDGGDNGETDASTSTAEPVAIGTRDSLRAFGFSSRHHGTRQKAQQQQQQQQQHRHACNAQVAWMLRR